MDEHESKTDNKIKPRIKLVSSKPSLQQARLWADNATFSRRRSKTVVTLSAINKESSMADNAALDGQAPNFWPCKPNLAACCQNFAAFLANAAAKSTTNGKYVIPSAGYIYGYTRVLFKVLQLEPECCVYAYVYVKRLLSGKGNTLRIRPGNWRKILIGVCLLASKFVDDISMKNSDFAKVLQAWSLARINTLEFNILTALHWRAHVTISEYTVRYFELVQPRALTCDWEVQTDKIAPYFNVNANSLSMFFQRIMNKYPPGPGK